MTPGLAGRPAAAAALAAHLVCRALTRTPTASIPSLAALLLCTGVPAPVSAMQILEAVDHAELAAGIAAGEVSRIALSDDRVKKVIRAPGGLRVEHDAATGDLYLTPSGATDAGGEAAPVYQGVPLFIVTEKGFTYRLTLTPARDGSAQILIRNPAAMRSGEAAARDLRIAELVDLVRAVARREPVEGYAIEAGSGETAGGLALVETWRGPRLAAHVVEARDAGDAAELAARFGMAAAAAWLAAAGTGPSGGHLAVVVTEHGGAAR